MEDINNFFEMPEKEAEVRIPEKLTPKDRAKAYREKKLKENPNWDKERVKAWRDNNPDKYNLMMARYYFRKLTSEQKLGLLDEQKQV